MIKTIRKGSMREQDAFRRASMARMSPADRLNALIHARDRAFAPGPIKRVASHRTLI